MTDFDLQQQLIEARRRQYGQQAQFQAPQGQMVGRHYVAPNVLQQLAAGLRSFGGMQGQAMAEQELKDLSQKRQDLQTSEMQALTQALRGTPENAPPEGQQGPVRPAQPGGMEAFYGRAMASPLQSLQQVGMQGQISMAQEQAKRQQQQAEQQRIMGILQQAKTPQEALAAGVPAELVKTYYDEGLGKVKGINIDGQLTNPVTGEAIGTRVAPRVNPATDLLIPDPNNPGRMMLNQQLFGAKTELAKAGRPSINVDARNYNTQESEQSKVYGKGLGEIRTTINQAGYDAPQKLARLDRMEQLLSGIDGGAAAPALADIASFANSLGVKIDPKLGNKQAAEALAREMAGTLRQPGTGPMTDKDFDNFLKQVPSLSKTAEGRKEIMSTLRAAIQRDQVAAQFAREYARKNNGTIDDNFFDAMAGFYAQNPVVTPKMPPTNARGAAFSDPAKEQRYQEWLKTQGAK